MIYRSTQNIQQHIKLVKDAKYLRALGGGSIGFFVLVEKYMSTSAS